MVFFSKQSAVSKIMWWKTLEELGYPKNKVNGVNVKLLREIKDKARLNAESARSFQNNPCLSKLTDKSLLLVINLSTTVIFKLLNTSCSLLVLCILIIISVIPYNYNFNNCRLLQFSSDRDNMEWKMVSFWERNFALMPPPPPKNVKKIENYFCTCLATKIF